MSDNEIQEKVGGDHNIDRLTGMSKDDLMDEVYLLRDQLEDMRKNSQNRKTKTKDLQEELDEIEEKISEGKQVLALNEYREQLAEGKVVNAEIAVVDWKRKVSEQKLRSDIQERTDTNRSKKQIQNLKEVIAHLESELDIVEDKLAAGTNLSKNLREETEDLDERAASTHTVDSKLEGAETRIEELGRSTFRLTNKLAREEKLAKRDDGISDVYRIKADRMERENQDFRTLVADEEAKKQRTHEDLEHLEKDLSTLKRDLDNAEQNTDQLRSERKKLQRAIRLDKVRAFKEQSIFSVQTEQKLEKDAREEQIKIRLIEDKMWKLNFKLERTEEDYGEVLDKIAKYEIDCELLERELGLSPSVDPFASSYSSRDDEGSIDKSIEEETIESPKEDSSSSSSEEEEETTIVDEVVNVETPVVDDDIVEAPVDDDNVETPVVDDDIVEAPVVDDVTAVVDTPVSLEDTEPVISTGDDVDKTSGGDDVIEVSGGDDVIEVSGEASVSEEVSPE